MLAYRVTQDINEIENFKKNKVYFNNKPLFNVPYNNSLYKVNTFPNTNNICKYFYYFPQDAYEIGKTIIQNSPKNELITIMEYEIENNLITKNIGFGNYKFLKRKDYLPKCKLKHISPYENSTYPVLEIRISNLEIIKTTGKIIKIQKTSKIPDTLNDLKKLKQFIIYKTYLEKLLFNLNINYPHGKDGLMMISEHNENIKEIEIPKEFIKFIC